MKEQDLILAASDLGSPIFPASAIGQPKHGIICVANESTFNQAFLSEGLTTYSTGWRDPTNLQEFLDFCAPAIPAARRFEFKKTINSEVFLSEDDDIRALDADFKKVQYQGETATGIVQNKGLTYIVDLDRMEGEQNWRQRIVGWLRQRLLRNDFRRAIAGLSGGATNVNKTWDTPANPDADMADALDLGGDAAGFEPTRGIIGKSAWLKRFKCLSAKQQPAAGVAAYMTPEQIATQLGLEGLKISPVRYQSSASAKSKVVGDIAIFFFAENGQMADDPSNIKRFVRELGDGLFNRVYEQELSSKLIAITVEGYSTITVIQSTGLRKLTITQ